MERKVIVVVEGGIVQSAYSNDGDIQLDVLDWDNFRGPDCDSKEQELYERLNREMATMADIY